MSEKVFYSPTTTAISQRCQTLLILPCGLIIAYLFTLRLLYMLGLLPELLLKVFDMHVPVFVVTFLSVSHFRISFRDHRKWKETQANSSISGVPCNFPKMITMHIMPLWFKSVNIFTRCAKHFFENTEKRPQITAWIERFVLKHVANSIHCYITIVCRI